MLEFDAENHIYRLDGVIVPSVSEVLRFASRELYGSTSVQALEIAADRGTRVHAATEALDRNGTADIDPDIEPYVRAYAQFLKDNKVRWAKIEEHVAGYDYKGSPEYAGTLDRLGFVNDVPTLMDVKTTRTITARHKRLYAAQMTAYCNAISPQFEPQLMILQLKNNGGYEPMIVDREIDIWNGCLTLHKAFAARKRGKKNG